MILWLGVLRIQYIFLLMFSFWKVEIQKIQWGVPPPPRYDKTSSAGINILHVLQQILELKAYFSVR